jgi:hypothetical protein
MKSILYVRLPCRKIYPGGLITIADYVHKHSPATKQRIIELSLIPPSRRRAYLKEAIRYSRPDVIAFSWRNIQTFAPNDTTSALDSVFKYDYSKLLTDKIYSVYAGFRLLWDFIYQLQRNISYIKLARKLSPQSRLVVGGTAFSCFPDELIMRLPEGTIGVDGEGERAMLKILEDRALDDEKVVYVEDGRLVKHSAREFIKLEEFTPDQEGMPLQLRLLYLQCHRRGKGTGPEAGRSGKGRLHAFEQIRSKKNLVYRFSSLQILSSSPRRGTFR